MKILSLNTWHGGRLKDELTRFVEKHAGDIDVFCFQETEGDFEEIVGSLKDGYKETRSERDTAEGGRYLRTYIKQGVDIIKTGEIFKEGGGGLGSWILLKTSSGSVWICSFHGVAFPGEKFDTPERLDMSRMLLECAADQGDVPKVFMGDFNLEKDTESVTMFEKDGFRNLIRDFDIKTTRNTHAWSKGWPTLQYYADYTFVKGVPVMHFEIPPEEVSDHQAMLLEI